jgi:hypothetical protein
MCRRSTRSANLRIKGGTNLLHGSVYDFYRRTWLDADTFNNNSRGAPRASHLLDQPGYQVDGPVYIPKVYNGKNRTFFNTSFEKIHEKSPAAITQSVPGPEMLTGDFSKLTTVQGVLIPIYDPLTGGLGVDPKSPTLWARQPFANNKIPQNRISQVALNVAKYMPAPNCTTPNSAYSSNNWCNSANSDEDRYWNFLAKIDHNINERNHVFFRYSGYSRSENRPFNGIEGPGASGQQPYHRISKSAGGDWVSTISPTLIFNLRASYTRLIEKGNADVNSGFDMVKNFGLPASLVNSLPTARNFGVFSISGYMQLGRGGVLNVDNDYSMSASITKIWKGHTLHAGFDLRQYNFLIENDSSNASGTDGILNISAGSAFTQQYFNNSTTSGNALASFLLGYPGGNIQSRPFPWMKQWYAATYLQDDWKVTPRLTLNLGLRWDANLPVTEKYNRMNIGFDSTTTSPLASLVNPALFPYGNGNLKGGMIFAGTNGSPTGSYNATYANVAPRLRIPAKPNSIPG